jgi:hypothetical protein
LCGKPFYCSVIELLGVFSPNPAYVARIFSLICSILSIIAIYFFFERKSNSGFIASFFFALSFTIVSWTNFVLPDSFAILLFLLFLCAGERWIVAIILLFLSGLVRPEYLSLLPLSILLYPKNKKAWVTSLALFLSGAIYYILTYDFPSHIITIKNSFFDFPLNILEYEPALVLGALASFFVLNKKKDEHGKFFIAQIVLFIAIFAWNNPSNWRYGMHLVVPLIYFGSSFVRYAIENVVRGVRVYDYVLVGFAVLIILQFYISYTGVL